MATAQIKSLVLSEEQTENLNKIRELMKLERVSPDHRDGYSVKLAVTWAIENLPRYANLRGGRPATGTGDDVLSRCNDAVNAQIELNRNTQKTVQVGRGKNSITVRYEQRAITERWLRDKAGVNAQAVEDFMLANGDMINQHNEWLVKNCGYPVDADIKQAIENFNRRTSKAELRASGKGEI
jgi:hypothetical protein